ncbi:MAG: hypothetical protein KDJ35_01235 [Alphaproteobacteria bacterium]|nr:hypothetical protein [Alphaproteobacteria bacterium]
MTKQSIYLLTAFWIASLTLAMTTVAYAQEPVTYAPEYCEFQATFPEEPYTKNICEGDNNERCYDQVSYTKVFDLDTTVNVRVICNKVSKELHDTYSGEIMEATLRAMTADSVIKTYKTSFREGENYKQAGLVGEGKVGRTSTIYIAQLWIGKKSAFSVEAEVIGEGVDDADKLFSDILRSIGPKAEKAQVEPSETPEN